MVKRLLTLLLLPAAALLSAPETKADTAPGLIQNIPGRSQVPLNGTWKAIVDPYEVGYLDYRLQPNDNGYAQDRDRTDLTALQEYDFDTDRSLNVPGDWNTQSPDLYYFVPLAHYPHNEAMVREAEKKGMLVWSEIPVYWTIHWDDPDTSGRFQPQGSRIGAGSAQESVLCAPRLVSEEDQRQ